MFQDENDHTVTIKQIRLILSGDFKPDCLDISLEEYYSNAKDVLFINIK